jgi:hypothetical protein
MQVSQLIKFQRTLTKDAVLVMGSSLAKDDPYFSNRFKRSHVIKTIHLQESEIANIVVCLIQIKPT